MNPVVIFALLISALLAGFLYLKRWYGRRRLAEIIFFAAFGNGTAWALASGAWFWSRGRWGDYDAGSAIGTMLYWLLIYGVCSLPLITLEVAIYRRMRGPSS